VLADRSVPEAKKLITETNNPDTLKRWDASKTRRELRAALAQRTHQLASPGQSADDAEDAEAL
jgi:hypothetical protein